MRTPAEIPTAIAVSGGAARCRYGIDFSRAGIRSRRDNLPGGGGRCASPGRGLRERAKPGHG